jgi:alkylation response protein AidB-like acyl-CoA dehydrogenase
MINTTSLNEEDRQLISATVERLSAEYFSIERCRAGDLVCGPEEWAAFAEQGLFAIGIDPEYGGIGGGATDLAIVTKQLGYNLLALAYVDTVVIAAQLIAKLGSEEQKQELLPAIAAGELRIGFAHRETESGDKFDHVEAAVSDDRISGQKIHVMDAALTAKLLVSARDGNGTLRFYLVDTDQPEVEQQQYRLLDNRIASRITFSGARGEPVGGDAAETLGFLYDLAALCTTAETVGAIAGLNRDTLEYAKVRKQFGQPIGNFQVLQHRLVDMFIAEQTAAALVVEALNAFDAATADAAVLVSAAKSQADRFGRQVGESAIQIHGGMGLTDECSVGHYLKRILTNGSQFGTAASHIARVVEHAV